MQSVTYRTEIGCGKIYITIGSDGRIIKEVFIKTGRSGGCEAQANAFGRLIALASRSGVELPEIIGQLRDIVCLNANKKNKPSCPDAISKVLRDWQSKRMANRQEG